MMLLYRNITAISRDTHRALKLRAIDGFAFAAGTHWLPVAGVEFSQAARSYPILFITETVKDEVVISPILLVGLEAGRNDYVNPAKHWRAGTYIPAFVRRYPFIGAEMPGKPDELTICFDADFEGFNQTDGAALLNEDGTNSVFLNNIIQFINAFTKDMKQNRDFIEQLELLELLEKRSITIHATSGFKFDLNDCLIISEDRFAKLTAGDLAALHRKGFLGWIFAHLMSLGNLPALLDLYLARKAH